MRNLLRVLMLFLLSMLLLSTASFGFGPLEVRDLDVAAGGYIQVQGPDQSNSYDWYDGGLYIHQRPGGFLGLGLNFSRWRGESGDGYEYWGRQVGLGPSLKLLKPGYDLTAKILLAWRRERGERNLYKMQQKTSVLYLSLWHNSWARAGKRFPQHQLWAWGEIDLDHTKKSTWNGQWISPQEDPAESHHALGAGGRIHILKGDWRPVAILEASHRHDWNYLAVGLGLTDKRQIVIVDVRRDLVNNTTGLGFFLDAGQFRRWQTASRRER